MTPFRLCEAGFRLYQSWCAALDRKDKAGAKVAKREYLDHRENCGECSKPIVPHLEEE